MKKNSDYIPQFDYDNYDESEYTYTEKCTKCGKVSVSLKDGLCFNCRSKPSPPKSQKCTSCGRTIPDTSNGLCFRCLHDFFEKKHIDSIENNKPINAEANTISDLQKIYDNALSDIDGFISDYCHFTKPTYLENDDNDTKTDNTIKDDIPFEDDIPTEHTAKKQFPVKDFFKKNGKYFVCGFIILLLVAAIVTPWTKSAYERKLEKAQVASAPETVWVYVTRTGECYHRENCSYLKSKIKISLEEAEKEYRRCSRCRPPKTDKD